MPPLDHLLVTGFSQSQDFKSTLSGGKQPPPQRSRSTHGNYLLKQLAALRADSQQLEKRRAELELPQHVGMTIALEISPPGSVDYFKQLEWRRDGIEVLSAVDAGGTEIVSLHVPDGALGAFEKRVKEYLSKDIKSRTPGAPDKPAHARLVNAISAFRQAVFDELWTEEGVAPPPANKVDWFQVWLRLQVDGSLATRNTFAESAKKFDIAVEPGYVSFPGRVVVAVNGTRSSLEQALTLLDLVAEIRPVAPTSEFYLADLKPHEQAEWIKDLHARSTYAAPDAPYVTLMDTGVNFGHPLLTQLLSEGDMHAVDESWGKSDSYGHGTEMAGLAAHGDLTPLLSSKEDNAVPHRLESVKLLPPKGQTPPHLYGWVTAQGAQKVEAVDGARRRTFAMMTTSEGDTAGLPSEWSATIDRLAFGSHGATADATVGFDEPAGASTRRLFVLAAGNLPWPRWNEHPTANDLASVENPAQAWNALTVGACTDLTTIDSVKWPSLDVLGSAGGLSPSSTTTLLWRRTWPFKPDVVAEGGNGTVDKAKGNQVLVGPESLRVLTTSHDIATSPLAESGDTSGAAAEVARICGHLHARYLTYWPETIRALVVHGARLTPAMRALLPLVPPKKDKENLLRRFGYGRVDLDGSLNSTTRRPTLVLQEAITPYIKGAESNISLGALNMHELPWPHDLLQELGEKSVELRITLSYFIEPNPSRRGWQSRFRYQSHGLRFAAKAATETSERFKQRINRLERDEIAPEDQEESMPDPDRSQWFLGAQLRSRGSIHSDVWCGTAAQLAEKSHIAVFPVGGWWKDWKDSERCGVPVRYALVVTLEVLQDTDVDIYTPIANMIAVPVAIATGGAPE
jgi:hypothetical protein